MTPQLGDSVTERGDDAAERFAGDRIGERTAVAHLTVEVPAIRNARRAFPDWDAQRCPEVSHHSRERFVSVHVLVRVQVGGNSASQCLKSLELPSCLLPER